MKDTRLKKKLLNYTNLYTFKDVLTSEWKSGNVLCWGRGFIFVLTREEKLWTPSNLIKIRFDQRRLPEDPDFRLVRNQDDQQNR